MAKRRRTVSAQTRVKLKQASAKRHRAPKGTPHGGHFLAGFGASTRHYAMGANPDNPGGRNPKFKRPPPEPEPGVDINLGGKGHRTLKQTRRLAHPGESANEAFATRYHNLVREFMNKGMSEADARDMAMGPAFDHAARATGMDPKPEQVLHDVRVTRMDATRRVAGTPVGTVESDTHRAERILAGVNPKKPTPREMYERLDESEKKELGDAESPLRKALSQGLTRGETRSRRYTSHGERDRQTAYFEARMAGMPREQAIQHVLSRRQGPQKAPERRDFESEFRAGRTTVAGGVSKSDVSRYTRERGMRTGRRTKVVAPPRAGEFSFGVKVPGVSRLSDIEKRWPGLSEADYVKLQQAERENIFDEIQKNQAWAHETRLANLQKGMVTRAQGPDRVTFFTTSLGQPNVSVPSDSLIGQYIIKRRKRMLQDEKLATGAQLRGGFPEAVRDMHVIEVGTGAKLGAEGQYGLYHQTGWRAGRSRSANYGKPVPVGSTILRDSSGQPIYDQSGNIVYTEGFTRPFKAGTPKEVGLRIFIG